MRLWTTSIGKASTDMVLRVSIVVMNLGDFDREEPGRDLVASFGIMITQLSTLQEMSRLALCNDTWQTFSVFRAGSQTSPRVIFSKEAAGPSWRIYRRSATLHLHAFTDGPSSDSGEGTVGEWTGAPAISRGSSFETSAVIVPFSYMSTYKALH